MPIAVEGDALSLNGSIFFDRCADQRSQFDRKSIARQLQYIQARFAGRGFQVGGRSSAKVDHFHRAVHDHAGGRVIFQYDTIGLGLDVDLVLSGTLELFCPAEAIR